MTRRNRLWFGLMEAFTSGCFIAWISISPRWHDPARIGFCLVVFAAAGVFIARQKPWMIAFLVSVWVSLLPLAGYGNHTYMFSVLPALFGAYVTYLAVEKPDLI